MLMISLIFGVLSVALRLNFEIYYFIHYAAHILSQALNSHPGKEKNAFIFLKTL